MFNMIETIKSTGEERNIFIDNAMGGKIQRNIIHEYGHKYTTIMSQQNSATKQ